MNKLSVFRAACVGLWFFAASSFADTDVFSGIYSIVNPATGAETDVMKIRKYSKDYGWFTYMGQGEEVQHGVHKAVESVGSEPSVRTLSLLGEGNIYFVTKGGESSAGRSDSGYSTDMAILAGAPLKHRPLSPNPERSVNGIHRYDAKSDEREVAIRVLNYSSQALQLGISDLENAENAVDTDPVNGNMSSAFNCCFYIREAWNGSQRLQVEIRSPDGKLNVTPIAVPRYESPENFEVAVNPDGRVEILFGRSDRHRAPPSPPVANKN
jgi:hypothetical protein